MANSTHDDRVSGTTEAKGDTLNIVTPEAIRTATRLSPSQERLARSIEELKESIHHLKHQVEARLRREELDRMAEAILEQEARTTSSESINTEENPQGG